MSAHEETIAAARPTGTTALFLWVWVALLVLTGVETLLAYLRLPTETMLTILVGLSLIKAALIVAYFMHLRFERIGLFLMLIPAFVFLLCMIMLFFFPDSLRMVHLGHL